MLADYEKIELQSPFFQPLVAPPEVVNQTGNPWLGQQATVEERHFIIQLITGCSETLRKWATSVPGALKKTNGCGFQCDTAERVQTVAFELSEKTVWVCIAYVHDLRLAKKIYVKKHWANTHCGCRSINREGAARRMFAEQQKKKKKEEVEGEDP